jgi:2-polyprenyl-3-methyl-5-hydroxy-6-metoxy-1,4-benzoquinol methylase
MFSYKNCPVCKSEKFKTFVTCEDHTVSHEKFNIVACDSCGFKFTNPIPQIDDLGNYYKSEEYISHSNTKKGIVSRLYHLVRNYTLKKKLQLVSSYVSRGTVLDYGCGTGMFLNIFHKAGWSTYGMEPDNGARKLATEMGLTVYSKKSELDPLIADSSLSVISLWHVLEHVTDLDDTLGFFKTKLNEKGILIIAVPNHKSEDAKHYKEFWAAYDVPRHLYHFEPKTIVKLLARFDFGLVDTKPMVFDSFYVSLLSEKYKSGSVNYLKAFLSGLRSNISAMSSKEYSSLIYVFKKK